MNVGELMQYLQAQLEAGTITSDTLVYAGDPEDCHNVSTVRGAVLSTETSYDTDDAVVVLEA